MSERGRAPRLLLGLVGLSPAYHALTSGDGR
jgi:hypothetical protein